MRHAVCLLLAARLIVRRKIITCPETRINAAKGGSVDGLLLHFAELFCHCLSKTTRAPNRTRVKRAFLSKYTLRGLYSAPSAFQQDVHLSYYALRPQLVDYPFFCAGDVLTHYYKKIPGKISFLEP